MEFWGEKVKPGMTVSCKAGDGFVIHLTQAALGKTKEGTENAVVSVKVGDEKLVIGTLSADKHPQTRCNLIFNEDFELSHSSKTTSVFFSGYKSVVPDMFESDSGEDEDEELETDEIPLKNNVTGSFMSQVNLRQLAHSMVVEALCKARSPTVKLYPTENDPDVNCCVCGTGVILVAESNFCYIMFKRAFVEKSEHFLIMLPDGSYTLIPYTRFSMPPKCSNHGLLAGCFVYQTDVEYDLKAIKAVDFGKAVERFDEVYLCDCASDAWVLTPGLVSYADEEELFHDCAPTPFSANGAAVFSADGKFVGITVEDDGGILFRALTVISTTTHLLKLYEDKQAIDQFLEKVKLIGVDLRRFLSQRKRVKRSNKKGRSMFVMVA